MTIHRSRNTTGLTQTILFYDEDEQHQGSGANVQSSSGNDARSLTSEQEVQPYE